MLVRRAGQEIAGVVRVTQQCQRLNTLKRIVKCVSEVKKKKMAKILIRSKQGQTSHLSLLFRFWGRKKDTLWKSVSFAMKQKRKYMCEYKF